MVLIYRPKKISMLILAEHLSFYIGPRHASRLDMPIDRQIRYATGVQYKWSDRLSTGAQFVYADYGKSKIDNSLLKGDYKQNDIFFFALNANWKF